MLAVVDKSEWPRKLDTLISGTSWLMSRLAKVCPYGIITTNRKSPVESRVLRFSVWFFHPFSNRKITLKEVELQEVFH